MEMERKASKLLRIYRNDNVLIVISPIRPGDRDSLFSHDIAIGHKVAAREIKAGEKVYKCGVPIGSAKEDVPAGKHIHLHNLKNKASTDVPPGWGQTASGASKACAPR